MKYINKDAIIAEIEKLKERYAIGSTRNNYEAGLKEGRRIGYIDALHKINTLEVKEEVNLEKELNEYGLYYDYTSFDRNEMQEEPVSVELEEASKNYALNNTPWDDCKDEIQESFKAGAKWDKEQMMSKAIDGYVIEDIEEGNGDFLLSAEYLPKSMGLKDRQKVKVIVIKED